MKKIIDKFQSTWNKVILLKIQLLYKLMFKKYK